MKRLELKRILSDDQGTVGMLLEEGSRQRICYTMELPNRQNQSNSSRIPEGEYRVQFLPRSSSGRYRRVYHLQAVRGRSGILIHAGILPVVSAVGLTPTCTAVLRPVCGWAR